jgi:predicted ATPase
MITSLELRNFKAHRETTLPLGQLTVLVGPNSAGKTSVLQALAVLGASVGEDPWVSLSRLGSIEDLVSRQANDTYLELAVTLQDSTMGKVGFRGDARGDTWEFTVPFQLSNGTSNVASRRPFTGVHSGVDWSALRNAGVFQFSASSIAKPGEWAQPQRLDGLNTASVLSRLKLADDSAFASILDGMRRLIPMLRGIRLPPVKDGQTAGNAIELDFVAAERIPATAVSEGTLVLLALLTALHGPGSPRLLLIDDIERSLHPTAQMELVDYVLTLLKQRPDVQMVVTTHSPFVLDRLDPDQIQVCFPRADGGIAVRALSEHPDARRAMGTISAGQLWTMDPESWVEGAQ